MTKHFALLFLLVSSIVSLGLSSNNVTSESRFTFNNPTPTPESSIKIELDRKEIMIPCEPGIMPRPGSVCEDIKSIIVRIIVSNSQNNKLSYKYTISGGQIIGEGEAVIWDLSNTRPGTYTITVAVDDNGKIKETKETITVRDCECVWDCLSCPTIWVSRSKSSAKAGETISFTANISGGSQGDITYKWTISEGEIIDGQGTPSINVKTTSNMAGKTVKTTVEIDSDEICIKVCPRTASETVSIKRK